MPAVSYLLGCSSYASAGLCLISAKPRATIIGKFMDDMKKLQKAIREFDEEYDVTSKKLIYIRDFDFDKWPFGY